MFARSTNFFKHNYAPLLCIWLATIAVLAPFIPQHFSTDDWIRISDQRGYIVEALSQSRVASAGFFWVLEYLQVNIVVNQTWFNLGAVTLFASAICVLYAALIKVLNQKNNLKLSQKLLIALALVVLVFPFASADLWQYGFVFFPFALAFLIGCIGIYFFIAVQQWWRWIVLVFCFGVAIAFYQPWITLLVLIGLVLTGCDAQKTLPVKLWQGFGLVAVSIGLMLLSVAWVKFGYPHFFPDGNHDPRVTGVVNIAKNARIVLGSLDEYYWANLGSFVPGVWLSLLIASLTLLKNWYDRLWWVGICTVVSIFAYAPHVFSATVLMSPRSVAAVFALPIVAVLIYISSQKLQVWKNSIAFLIVGISLAMSLWTHTALATALLQTNAADQLVASTINAEITQYELKTGAKIEILYFGYDASSSPCYQDIGDCWYIRYFFVRQFAPGVSPSEILRRSAPHNMLYAWTLPDKKAELFGANINYDRFVLSQQLRFEENRAYLLIF